MNPESRDDNSTATEAGGNPAKPQLSEWLRTAIDYHEQNKLQKAEAIYRQILGEDPNHADALHLLGVVAFQTGHDQTGIELITKAIARNRLDPFYHNNLGNIFRKLGNLQAAVGCYEEALRLKPRYAEAHYNLATALREQGNLEAATQHYRNALLITPEDVDLLNDLAGTLRLQGDVEGAIGCYRVALHLEPDMAELHANLGRAFEQQGDIENAVPCYQKAIEIAPGRAELHHDLGIALKEQGKLPEAIAAYQQALALKPDFAEVHNDLGIALKGQGKLDEAMGAHRQALALKPDFAQAHNNLGNALKEQGKFTEATAAYRQALALKPDYTDTHSNLLLCLHYGADTEPAEVFIEHQRWAEQHALSLADTIDPHANDPTPNRRLRIGYLSPDFRTHSVVYFVEPLLAAHDRTEFEVICYANVVRRDAVTERLQALAERWRNMVGVGDEQAAELVREDGVDILVDLAGHTANNRLLVFARKPAPVQVSYLGYPNTTGLDTMDYRVTDAWADPPGYVENLYTEELVRLPGGFLCYRPPQERPGVAELPALTAGHITFASFNNATKVNPEVVALWSKILQVLPDARLIMKASQLGDVGTRQRFEELFEQNGVSTGRVELLGWASSTAEHLELYNRVDIGLDPFPYNGTTTTCEALWMGVPVIVLAGNTHAARVGVSLLSNGGLPELIAQTPKAYVELAIRLARDQERLYDLRAGLRDKMEHSRLTDAVAFTRTVEAAYRTMWKRWCESQGV